MKDYKFFGTQLYKWSEVLPIPEESNDPLRIAYEQWVTEGNTAEQSYPGEDELTPVRYKRNSLLALCDWTVLSDAPLDSTQKAAWISYRQALRDLPQSYPNPIDVIWPSKP